MEEGPHDRSAGLHARRAWALAVAGASAGCNPVINLQGAFFPAWIICILGGAALAGLAHRLFLAAGIQRHLGPPAVIYPSLVILLTMAIWLTFYAT